MSVLSRASAQKLPFGWVPALGLAVLIPVSGCHRTRTESVASASATSVPSPPPIAPRELLADGALRAPSETWRRLRTLLGGSALRLPSTYPLAITTLIGASPLVAGLIDDIAPVALAIVALDGANGGATLVLGMHVTSGAELTVALANGSDARFTSKPDPVHGFTLLVPKTAPNDFALCVADDTLVLAGSASALAAAAGYVAHSRPVPLGDSESLHLVARKAALAGHLAGAIRDTFRDALRGLDAAAATSRRQHGRDPDFGDPAVVMEALASLSEAATRIASSAQQMTLSASLLDRILDVSIDIEPESTGAASELVRDVALGDPSPIGGLPQSTEAAVFWQRSDSTGGPSAADRLVAVFGERLGGNDRQRIVEWTRDVARGAGTAGLAGIFLGEGGPGAFFVGSGGHAEALHRAIATVPSLLLIPAIARPLREFVGQLQIERASHEIPALGATTELLFRRRPSQGTRGMKTTSVAVDVVGAATESHTALVVGPAGIGATISDVVTNHPDGIGTDPVVAHALARAGGHTAIAAFARFHDESSAHDGWAALGFGTDRRVIRVDVTLSDLAVRMSVRRGIAP